MKSVNSMNSLDAVKQDVTMPMNVLRRRALFLGSANALDYAVQFLLPVMLARTLEAEAFGEYRLLWLVVMSVLARPAANIPELARTGVKSHWYILRCCPVVLRAKRFGRFARAAEVARTSPWPAFRRRGSEHFLHDGRRGFWVQAEADQEFLVPLLCLAALVMGGESVIDEIAKGLVVLAQRGAGGLELGRFRYHDLTGSQSLAGHQQGRVE